MHIGQPIAPALELIVEPLMIDAQEMHKCGLKIMDMYRIFHNVVTKIISFTIGESFFDPCAGHPNSKTPGMMIPAIIILGQFTL